MLVGLNTWNKKYLRLLDPHCRTFRSSISVFYSDFDPSYFRRIWFAIKSHAFYMAVSIGMIDCFTNRFSSPGEAKVFTLLSSQPSHDVSHISGFSVSTSSGISTLSDEHGERINLFSTSPLGDFDSNRTTRQSIGSDKGPSSKRRGLRWESYTKQGFLFCSLLKEHCYDFSSLQGTYKGSTSC